MKNDEKERKRCQRESHDNLLIHFFLMLVKRETISNFLRISLKLMEYKTISNQAV